MGQIGRRRCVLMGDQSLLSQCGEILRRRGHEIVAVATESPSVADWAKRHGVRVISSGTDLEGGLSNLRYDWFFSIANLRIVPEPVWRKAERGAANFHDGPLPRYAGLNAPSWAILNGETDYGVTWHALTSEIDAGDIYAQRHFEIAPDETAFTLNSRCFEAGMAAFEDLAQAIEDGGPAGAPQDLRGRTLFAKHARPEAAGALRLDQPAASLDRLRRALDFGPGYANPLVLPKLVTGDDALPIAGLERLERAVLGAPGSILAVEERGLVVAVADGAVRVTFAEADGRNTERPVARFALGQALPCLTVVEVRRLTRSAEAAARHEEKVRSRIECLRPLTLAVVKPSAGTEGGSLSAIAFPAPAVGGDRLVAAVAGFLARETGQDAFDVAYADAAVRARSRAHPGLFEAAAPLRVEVSAEATAAMLGRATADELRGVRRRGGHLSDLVARQPGLVEPRLPVGVVRAAAPSPDWAIKGCAATFVVPSRGTEIVLVFDEAQIADVDARALARRAEIAVAAFAHHSDQRVRELPLMSDADQSQLLERWSRSGEPYDRDACVHTLIERQADRTPDAVAVTCGRVALTYRELDARANQIAHALVALGVGPDRLVGLCLERSVDLVTAALGIQKAGGAYVPLDPAYPPDRLAFMIEDSGLDVVVTERSLQGQVAASGPRTLLIEDVGKAGEPKTRVRASAGAQNLAYVIYTSGSTGRPKGVMVEHRNVVNFFAGMDERVAWRGLENPAWLAVTSLSFDISVLELFWTLSHGFKVVIGSAPAGPEAVRASARRPVAAATGMDFSLFYWGTDDGAGPQKYRLLLEGAKFADVHGFKAVWTPERHFHAFGDPYPNPAVTGAAVAAVTRNLSIRAGSCVLPLHHPARVAEEWAVLDNISNGRVGLAFASGWMPEDFVLRPENAPPHNKSALTRDIDIVRRLWRGEAVPCEWCAGKTVDVVTHPRPVQKELPVWVTTAGNPETYREAARLGANVLTHLLGQSIEELADKIRIYREALREAGHDPATHTVTLMLHTLIGADRAEAKALARGPMKDYLRSAAALIKQYAWAFPAFKKPQGVVQPMAIDLQSLSPEEMDAILDFAFERYFEDSGLFGTVEDAMERVSALRAIGVDEIACLIDFGIASDVVLDHLNPLALVVEASALTAEDQTDDDDFGIAAEIRRHEVTHLQCTPSMAGMLLQSQDDRVTLSQVRHLYIGGEALTASLLAELALATAATVQNMYGPTETTIWSSTGPATGVGATAPLGRPITNTQLYVLDPLGRLCPPGCPGELFIGGEGVARGYLNRPELTDERFRPDPFSPSGRIYQTGDLVSLAQDGALNYLGRVDHQVKLRGRRIELGEIEARLREFAGVREAVVMVREDRPGDARLVAYVQPTSGAPGDAELRDHLAVALPDYMVPAHFVSVETFPLTPNAKIDRKALPAPGEVRAAAPAEAFAAPANDAQREVAETFRRILGLERVGLNDNFFALGGHSLLAVQAHRELKASIAPTLAITDLFRFQTVAALADHIAQGKHDGKANSELQAAAERAALRRRGLAGRVGALGRAREIA